MTYVIDLWRWVSLGYDVRVAISLTVFQESLIEGMSRLYQCRHGPPADRSNCNISILAYIDITDTLLRTTVLWPKLAEFADALSSVTPRKDGYINITLHNVQLGDVVSKILLQSFKTAPVKRLILLNTVQGMRFAINALMLNTTVEALYVKFDQLESKHDATSLCNIVMKHPRIEILMLPRCRLGESDAVMTAIVPVLNHLKEVDFMGNSIGSLGAALIANSLANNSVLIKLDLNNNMLNNRDAAMLAASLKTNTKLRVLELAGNNFTQVGIDTLGTAVGINGSSLNAIFDSNHTCGIKIGDPILNDVNNGLPKMNRSLKIRNSIIPHNAPFTNIQGLADVPVGILPKVLVLVQDGRGVGNIRRCEAIDTSKYNGLNSLFHLMRELNELLPSHLCLLERTRRMQHTIRIDERPASFNVKLLIKPKGVTKTLPLQECKEAMTAKARTTKVKKIAVAARTAATEAIIDETSLQVANRRAAIESARTNAICAQRVIRDERPASVGKELLVGDIELKGAAKTLPFQKRKEAIAAAKACNTEEKKIPMAAKKAVAKALRDEKALQVANRRAAIESARTDAIRAKRVIRDERPASVGKELLVGDIGLKGAAKTLPFQKRKEAIVAAKACNTEEKKIAMSTKNVVAKALRDEKALQVVNRRAAIESARMDAIRAKLASANAHTAGCDAIIGRQITMHRGGTGAERLEPRKFHTVQRRYHPE